MNSRDDSTKFTEIQLKDALFKLTLYLHKITDEADPHPRKEKLAHLAVETSLKFAESDRFAQDVYERIKTQLQAQKNYYLLYALDILLKNHRNFNKLVRKDVKELEAWFKSVWEKVWTEPKNSAKIQCLKAMARTWGVLFGDKIQQNIKRWVDSRFNTSLKLSERNEEEFRESYEKQKQQRENKEVKGNLQKFMEALAD